jgi:hypothetical protein
MIYGPYTGKKIIARTAEEEIDLLMWAEWVREERKARQHAGQLEQQIRQQLKTRY